MLKILLKYKWYRIYCIKQYIKHVKKYYAGSISHYPYLCNFKNETLKFWIPCWTKIKEIQQNEDSKYLNGSINCNGIKFWNNQNRIEFLEECLKL